MPDGTTYNYTYDRNELRNIRIPGMGNITYPSYTMGRPDSVSFPGGTRTYSYDALLRTTNITAPGMNYSYPLYDKAGNILTKQTEHGTYGYGYDDLYRLTGANAPAANESYDYDPVGNRLSAPGVVGPIQHNQNNELRQYGGTSFDYDPNGNLTSETTASGTRQYIYNVQNRLIRVEENSQVIAEYGYDPFGRRLWKAVSGTRTYFLYSDEGLAAEYDAAGNELRSYGYRPDSTWGTDPLWLKEGGVYYWFQNDHLGTPQKLVDSSGTVAWSATYSAFGEATTSVETITNNFRFPGQYFDTETGWHYNWYRYYNPRVGRYMRTDPAGYSDGENLYAYVHNSPIRFLDPSGLETVLIFTTEKGPKDSDNPWRKAAELAGNLSQIVLGREYESLEIVKLDVNKVSQLNSALQQYEDIVAVFIIGHASAQAIFVGQDAVPDTNISHVIRGSHPKDLDWSHLTDDATTYLWGCNAGEGGPTSIAQAVSNASGGTVIAPTVNLNFDELTGEPFIRLHRILLDNGEWVTFEPDKSKNP